MTSIDSFDDIPWFRADPPSRRVGWMRTLRRVLWSLAKVVFLVTLLGAGLVVANQVVSERRPVVPVPIAPPDSWTEIRRPIPVFALTGTDFAKLPLVYTASRHATGGGRKDVLTFGDLQGAKPWLRLALYRVGAEAPPAGPANNDLEDLGRDAGVELSGIGAPSTLPTRFGPIEAADLRLGLGTATAPCLGFRSVTDAGAALRVTGLVCGSAARPVGRDLLGCIIDRIDLLSAGDDETLRNLFVEAERRRGPACQPSPLTAAGSRTTWLDANSTVPPLKRLSASPQKGW